MDHVNTRDELKLYCIDRTRNDPYYHLPLRDDISGCPGFIGRGMLMKYSRSIVIYLVKKCHLVTRGARCSSLHSTVSASRK